MYALLVDVYMQNEQYFILCQFKHSTNLSQDENIQHLFIQTHFL